MSGTLTVKELIKKLLKYSLNEPVYIGLGPNTIPDAGAEIFSIRLVNSGSTNYGVYMIPDGTFARCQQQPEGNDMTLPPLPPPDMANEWESCSSRHQVRAYGIACARAALEEAAKVCNEMDYGLGDIALAIRAIKIEETP